MKIVFDFDSIWCTTANIEPDEILKSAIAVIGVNFLQIVGAHGPFLPLPFPLLPSPLLSSPSLLSPLLRSSPPNPARESGGAL